MLLARLNPDHNEPVKSQPPPSPWFSRTAINREPDPETDHPPSPMETQHHHKVMAAGYAEISNNVKRAHEIIQMRQRQRSRDEEEDTEKFISEHHRECGDSQQQQVRSWQHSAVKQSKQLPNYPSMIRIPSRDEYDCVRRISDEMTLESKPFDEKTILSVELGEFELSLEDTFGIDKKTKNENDDDDTFEKIYSENDEEDGTLQSSVELNAYSSIEDVLQPSVRLNAHASNVLWKKRIDPPTKPDPVAANKDIQRGTDSIFRSHWNAAADLTLLRQQRNANTLVSPTVVMDRRLSSRPKSRSRNRSTSRNHRADSLRNRSASRNHREYSIQRTPSIPSTTTSPTCNLSSPGSQQSPSRSVSCNHREHSIQRTTSIPSTTTTPTGNLSPGSHRSHSRGISRSRRSRSRSTSIAPPMEGHDANLFRGAALVRGQLLRSMSSADEAMEKAASEDERQKQLQDARRATSQRKREVPCAQSFDEDGSPIHSYVSSPTRSSCARYAASHTSQDSSSFETESRRLDNIIGLFASNGSSAGSNELKIDVLSTTSSWKQGAPASNHRAQSPTQNENALQTFQEEDAPMIATSPETTVYLEQSRRTPQATEVDEALAHAQKAGPFWRSLVGNHVRFPSSWNGVLPPTAPAIYCQNFFKWSKWYYVARHRVKGDKRLNSREFGVRSRSSGGRILMRMVIRQLQTQQVCREIAIGCFHPNSKGIRTGDPFPEAEDVREIWMAVRWLMDIDHNEPKIDLREEGEQYEGVVDNFLMQKKNALDLLTMGSTLGHRKAVNNENVRAIFGDTPPISTVDLHEDEFAEILKANVGKKLAVLPALMLLKLFLFTK